jgi:hypothetical protein
MIARLSRPMPEMHTKKPKKDLTEKPRCGLCGKTQNLTKTECCGQWICDDAHTYVSFSYAHNSCYRNHDRYTLCRSHNIEGHTGDWQTCLECREGFETEMYVYYGTNEYNFVKLEKPPEYEPTHCVNCNKIISLGYDGYTMTQAGYFCGRCSDFK